VHLVGFIIRIYHDARSPESQKSRNLAFQTEEGIQIKASAQICRVPSVI